MRQSAFIASFLVPLLCVVGAHAAALRTIALTGQPAAGMRRLVLMSLALTVLLGVVNKLALGAPGDFNGDGIVSHADLSLIGDGFGTQFFLPDYYLYVANYGQTASQPADLPLAVTAMPTPAGNLEWTFTFSNVNGALAGHLNISANGPTILSATGGPLFKDDGRDPVGVPGFNASHTIEEGISINGATAFAALGTTLTLSPSLLNSNSTLEFLRLVTAGVQPTTVTYAGEYGYQMVDYALAGSSSYVPVSLRPGDFNRDGVVTMTDIPAMEAALRDLNAFQLSNNLSAADLGAFGDINGDGKVTNVDLQSLLDLVKAGGGSTATVPEPSTLVLAVVAFCMLWWRFTYRFGNKQRLSAHAAAPATR
jgi:Dockerin type I domain